MSDGPQEAPPEPTAKRARPLEQWMLIGLVPAIIHGIVLLPAIGGGNDPVGGESALIWLLGMPVFALAYLILVALLSGEMRLDDGRRIHRALFVFGMLLLNLFLWVGGCALALV